MDPDLDWSAQEPLPKYGHRDCVVEFRPVPGDQGWRWDASSAHFQARPGWHPGAIPRVLGKTLGLRALFGAPGSPGSPPE